VYKAGDIVDEKYEVRGLCSDAGGMGRILFVNSVDEKDPFPIVLKYCLESDADLVRRFKREVRLLVKFQGNSKIVEVVDHNVDHDPPYFVMRYYPQGDLLKHAAKMRKDLEFQELVFNQMIDCVAELHATNRFHRDIKPQNFLVDVDDLVVSDFGVSKELGSDTGATKTSMSMGTVGYMPPEFLLPGGFKNADATSDIFMLGKSFYTLLSGRDPRYLVPDDIPEQLFAVIERCCALQRDHRYADLGTLKQRLNAAFDVLLGRKKGAGEVEQLLADIQEKLANERKYASKDVKRFVDLLQTLNANDRDKILFGAEKPLFRVLTYESVRSHLPAFLDTYRRMVETATYAWSFAENIADFMKILFSAATVLTADKVRALEIAIIAADRQNRYAAMDTCRALIVSIKDEKLGMRVAEMLARYLETFVGEIEPSSCATQAIRGLLTDHKKRKAAKKPKVQEDDPFDF